MKRKSGLDTVKISVSVAAKDLAILRRRAKRLYGGNLSAVIHDLVQRARKQEAMEKLIASLGGPSLTEEDRAAIDAEWAGR
jgi:phage baseplate assembly protein W